MSQWTPLLQQGLPGLAALKKNTRKKSCFSPNQLFFLRNWRDPSLPNLLAEPVVEEMVEARDIVRAGNKVKMDKDKRGWPKLYRSDMVRGRHPKTKEWIMKGEVVEVVPGERAVFVVMDNRSSRLYKREGVRLDTTKRYQKHQEEELNSQLVGTELEARKDHKPEETLKVPRKARQDTNTSNAAPRRSSRLAKKRATLRTQEEAHDQETLPYYMNTVEEGRAEMWWGKPKYGLEDQEPHGLEDQKP